MPGRLSIGNRVVLQQSDAHQHLDIPLTKLDRWDHCNVLQPALVEYFYADDGRDGRVYFSTGNDTAGKGMPVSSEALRLVSDVLGVRAKGTLKISLFV